MVDADLQFTLDLPGVDTVSGSLTGSGRRLELRVSDPFLFAGRDDASAVRGIAEGLARHGLSITVVAPRGPLVTLGVARASWLQRRVTGSRHIRVERGGGLWSLVRGRVRATTGGVLPAADLAPPATLLPLAPTLRRRPRQPVTTTHDPGRGGNPRLFLTLPEHPTPDTHQDVFPLRDDVTTIGSGPGCDIRLAGLDAVEVEVRHDGADEFVVHRIGRPGVTRVNGAPVDTALLRTGSRLVVGEWKFAFFREEYADHGRPYGGRVGGELGHQRRQPPRPVSPRNGGDRA
jgi:hypothetical protein